MLTDADVLVVDDRIAAVGPASTCRRAPPRSTPPAGSSCPGMIDTHRHMWQTAMRGYGADWTLTQYFVWYYLESGKPSAPRTSTPATCSRRIEALDAGVTTCVDWSHGLQTTEHADAAVDALEAVRAGSCSLTATSSRPVGVGGRARVPRLRPPADQRGDDMLGFQIAFDVTGDPAFPEKAAFEVARELGVPVTTHAGVWGATNDDGIRLMHENGFMTPAALRARRHASRPTPTTASPPPADRSRSPPRASRAPARATRPPGRCASTASRCRCRWTPASGGAVTCSPRCAPRSGADRSREHLEAHAKGETVTHVTLRAEQVVDWATRGGAQALGRDGDLGSLEPGKKADVVLIKNDSSPVSFPVLNPYGHVAFQAQRGDVHTVLVDGRVVKHDHQLVGVDLAAARREVEPTVEHLRSALGEEAWEKGMNPDVPETKILDNPYTLHRLPQRQHPRTLIRPLGKDRREMRLRALPWAQTRISRRSCAYRS